jgi:hypothetical protein
MFVLIRNKGRLYRIPRIPYESDEEAMDRAWYIALHCTDVNNLTQVESQASRVVYEKYYGMKYD